jgi:acyl carrier protein phosphodiesterase
MNYLAHALLSPEDPLILMGNLWGDLLKPKDYEGLDPEIVKGVRRHKAIDSFTDQHPAVDQMVRLIRPYQGKYTPVVADVLMDYILSKHWERYHPQSIEDFCRLTYGKVEEHLDLIPERLHPRIQRMVSHQWLESCKNRERMEQTLIMLSRRASFDNKIPEALIPYDLHDKVMDDLFVDFFADMQQYISLQNAG